MTLTEETARGFAQMTLPNLTRRYPFKLDQVILGPDDLVAPAELHPIFHGSFDWHSCVHGYWQVLRLLRLFPDMPEAADIRVLADAMLVPPARSRGRSRGSSGPTGLGPRVRTGGPGCSRSMPKRNGTTPVGRVRSSRSHASWRRCSASISAS